MIIKLFKKLKASYEKEKKFNESMDDLTKDTIQLIKEGLEIIEEDNKKKEQVRKEFFLSKISNLYHDIENTIPEIDMEILGLSKLYEHIYGDEYIAKVKIENKLFLLTISYDKGCKLCPLN